MSVLSRVAFASQQRVDLQHMLGQQSFNAFDFRAMLQMMNGLNKNYVINGLEINGVSGLAISISVKNCMVVTPLDGITSFFVATSDDPDVQLVLPPAVSNVFVEAYFERSTEVPVTTGFFDPGAVSETNPAGSEFTASVDFQEVINLKFRYKTDGFTSDAIPVAKITTSPTAVTLVTDSRNLFYRLGTGGASPNPFFKYEWSSLRQETSNPGPASAIGQLNSNNPYFVADADGAKNDKSIKNMKEWMDAVMSVIAEMKGTPTWYFPTVGKTIPNLLFLTGNATSITSVPNRTIQWSRANDEKLRSKGTGLPTSWAMNYGPVKWYLGGSFVSSATRQFSTFDWEISIDEAQAFFLLLQRETRPSGVPTSSVKWGTEFISPAAQIAESDVLKHVKGQQGDFTGVAIGDYVRKEGSDYFEYYRVTGIVEAGSPIQWSSVDIVNENIAGANWGTKATNACTGLLLERSVDETATEPYRWFRAAYSQDDMYKTATDPFKVQSNSVSPLVIDVDDINLYWLGRRSSQINTSILLFRDYGNMSPGEEMVALDDSDGSLKSITSTPVLNLDPGTAFDSSQNLTSLNSTRLTLSKRKTDNLVNFGSNNGSAWQKYQITATINFPNDGDGLWVRLDDAQSVLATLSSGTVDPSEPTVPTTNVYEVLPETQNPLRNFRNVNVFLVCRRVTFNGIVSLQFFDGTILQSDGVTLQKDISKVITGVTTSTTVTSTATHGFLRNTKSFIWNARRTSTDEVVNLAATHTNTGLILEATPGGAENLTLVFSRHVP